MFSWILARPKRPEASLIKADKNDRVKSEYVESDSNDKDWYYFTNFRNVVQHKNIKINCIMILSFRGGKNTQGILGNIIGT
jgi:hypothetical protein